MTIAFLPSIDIADYTAEGAGLSPKQLSYFRNVYTVLTPSSIEDAFTYLQQTVGLYETCFNVTALGSSEDIVSLLDSGAAQVFVSQQQLQELEKVDNVDQSRLVLSADHKTATSIDLGAQKRPLHLAKVEDAQAQQDLLSKRKEEDGPVYVTVDALDGESAMLLHTIGAIPILPARTLTVDADAEPDLVSAADVLMVNAKSDRPDGLYTTLVTDERGIALGLVYSNEESVAESLKTGRGVYWSRKRGLWRKGETTGDIQELVSVAYDCDADCLNFTVRQKGRGWLLLNIEDRMSADCFQDSVTWQQLHVLDLTVDFRSYSRPSKHEKSPHQKGHTLQDYSTTQNCSMRRSRRKLVNYAMRRRKITLHSRLLMCFTLP